MMGDNKSGRRALIKEDGRQLVKDRGRVFYDCSCD